METSTNTRVLLFAVCGLAWSVWQYRSDVGSREWPHISGGIVAESRSTSGHPGQSECTVMMCERRKKTHTSQPQREGHCVCCCCDCENEKGECVKYVCTHTTQILCVCCLCVVDVHSGWLHCSDEGIR